MAKLRELTFDVLFRDRATKSLKRADKAAGRLKKGTKNLRRESQRLETQQKSLTRSTMNLGSAWKLFAGSIIGVFVIGKVVELGRELFKLTAQMESVRIGFEVMLGSKEKAKSLIADIKKFSLATPFTPQQLFAAADQLINFGFAQEEIIPTMKLLGDISKGNTDKFRRLALAFAQVRGVGRLMGQDNLQLINAGFIPLKIIAQQTGEEMKDIKKRMEEGGVSFDEVKDAMIRATSKGGLFFNAMARGALGIEGMLSTLEGFRQEILVTIGDEGLQVAKDFTKQLIDMAKATLEWLKVTENAEGIKKTFQDLALIISTLTEAMAALIRTFVQVKQAGSRTLVGRAGAEFAPARFFEGFNVVRNLLAGKNEAGGSIFESPATTRAAAQPSSAVAPAGAGGGVTMVNQIEINERIEDVPGKLREVVLETLDATVPQIEAQFAK